VVNVNHSSWDVVVVGAGPAGSSLATRLARRGLSVLVLEGKRFPRAHIGESLLAMSMPYLRDLGVEPSLDAYCVRKTGSIFAWGGIERHLPMPAPGYAYQVPRDWFDQVLLERAQAAGASVRENCWATTIHRDASGRFAGVETSAGDSVNAKFVVDSSGLHRLFQRRLSLSASLEGPRRAAIVQYMQGAHRYAAPYAGDIVTEAGLDGWLWFIPLSDEVTSVGFVGDECDVPSDIGSFFARQVASTRVIRRLSSRAVAVETPRLLRYANQIVQAPLWRDGAILVGDAAMFVDPLFSTGVHAALYSSALAAASIRSILAGDLGEEQAASEYDARMRAHYRRVNATVRVLYGLHDGRHGFWRRRALELDEPATDQLVCDLGSVGMRFFVAASKAAELPMPAPLMARALAQPDVRVRKIGQHEVLALSSGVRLSDGWIVKDDRLVPALVVRNEEGAVEMEFPSDATWARLLRRIDGVTALGPLIESVAEPASDRTGVTLDKGLAFAGALLSAGVLTTSR
jgi:halogenation protein CepH